MTILKVMVKGMQIVDLNVESVILLPSFTGNPYLTIALDPKNGKSAYVLALIEAVERFATSYNAKPEDVLFEHIQRQYEEDRDLHMVLRVSLPDNPKQREGMKKAILDGAKYKAMRLESEFKNYQDLKKRFDEQS